MTKLLFAVIDLVADEIAGGIHLMKHEAAAVRLFRDTLDHEGSMIAAHPQDFVLVKLGHIDDEHKLHPEYKTIITGAALAATVASTEARQRPVTVGARGSAERSPAQQIHDVTGSNHA